MISRKFWGISTFASLSFGLMSGCAEDTTTGALSNLNGIQNGQGTQIANVCGDLIPYVDEASGTTYCFDANNQLQYYVDAAGNITNANAGGATPPSIDPQNTAISSSTQITSSASTPLAESSNSLTPIQSSNSTVVIQSSVSATSNGNAPSIAYATTGATLTNDNGCVTVTGGEVVISCAGEYEFSGSYKGSDAQIRVNSPKADSGVYLNLRGLTLENTDDVPIYVQQASKAFIVAKKETVNTLSDGSTRTKTFTYQNEKGETKVDTTAATIYSKDDLTIKGAGTLNVTGNANNGIQSSNDLRFRGETIVTVNAKNNGVKGKGSVQVGSGTLTITTTEGDGIKSDECVENAAGECTAQVEGKGYVEITGGTINITAGDDGIQAINKIYINENDGTVNIKVKAGDGQPDKSSSGGFGGGPGGGNFGGGFGGFGGGGWGAPGANSNTGTTTTTSTESSNKGIVSADSIIINAGTIEVAAHKDAIHSNTYVDVYGGTFTLAGRNAIHADEVITIHDGTIHMTETFEALEARQIIAKGGVTASESSNDGWNAGTGNEGCTGNCKIEVTGGVHYMHIGSGDTDGMDSNGDINVTGGVVVVECEMDGGMGGSFDSNGKTTLNSKTLIGFGKRSSEEGKNYSVSFNTNSYYGTSSIAFKPTFSGSYIQTAGDQPSTVSSISSYAKSTTLPNGLTVYYNN